MLRPSTQECLHSCTTGSEPELFYGQAGGLKRAGSKLLLRESHLDHKYDVIEFSQHIVYASSGYLFLLQKVHPMRACLSVACEHHIFNA